MLRGMYDAVFVNPWPWWAAGAGIGLVVVALAALASRPLSVTTGLGSACAMASNLPYLKPIEFGSSYADFRKVQGVLIPFEERTVAMGQPTGVTTLQKVELLDTVPVGTFPDGS